MILARLRLPMRILIILMRLRTQVLSRPRQVRVGLLVILVGLLGILVPEQLVGLVAGHPVPLGLLENQ